jgi:hypothetical protein
MSSTSYTIAEMIRMMLRGITSNVPVDPVEAAHHFECILDSELDLVYAHHDGIGYVIDGVDEVMLVHFTHDGVEFDEHTEHPLTLRVIQCALHTLTHLENELVMSFDDDDDSDDMEWV